MPDEETFISEIAGARHGRIRRGINGAVAHHRSVRLEPFVRELCEEYIEPIVRRAATGRSSADWSDEIVSGTYPALHRNER